LCKLAEDPFTSESNTHKVRDIDGDPALASWVTGDLRVIWDFSDEEEYALDLLDIGGHSGKK
jgi:mRNA-degrading endonuclease YafQ of YafQ-DinJ toxin-antitoxin module